MGGLTCINVSYLVHVVYKQIFFTLPFKVECFVNSGPMETVCCVKNCQFFEEERMQTKVHVQWRCGDSSYSHIFFCFLSGSETYVHLHYQS